MRKPIIVGAGVGAFLGLVCYFPWAVIKVVGQIGAGGTAPNPFQADIFLWMLIGLGIGVIFGAVIGKIRLFISNRNKKE